MKQKTLFITALVVLAALFAGGAQWYRSEMAREAAATAAKNRESLVRAHSPRMGRPDAPVHIVEFLDPACETCAAFYPVVKKMMAERPESIRLTIRYAPFHRGSDDVVKALEASRRQAKFGDALEALIASQGQWAIHHQARVDLIWPILAGAGLDIDRLKADMGSVEIARVVAQDLADARTLGVSKTPEFFVNGRPLPSFGLSQLQALVDEEVALARK